MPFTTVTAPHVTQGRVEYESTIHRSTDEGFDLWEAQQILRNQHEYGTITDTMTLLKPIHKTSLLIPYEQIFIQAYQYNGTLITEQNRGDQSPLFQLAIDTVLTSQLLHNK